jgi:hypothetical protein
MGVAFGMAQHKSKVHGCIIRTRPDVLMVAIAMGKDGQSFNDLTKRPSRILVYVDLFDPHRSSAEISRCKISKRIEHHSILPSHSALESLHRQP